MFTKTKNITNTHKKSKTNITVIGHARRDVVLSATSAVPSRMLSILQQGVLLFLWQEKCKLTLAGRRVEARVSRPWMQGFGLLTGSL